MRYYAVIDTNVLVSTMLKWNSVPGSTVELTFDGPIVPILNDEIKKNAESIITAEVSSAKG